MKLNIKKTDVVSEGLESKKVTINTGNIELLEYILSEGLYEDSITAAVVESVNNSVDSVVAAGKNPVENPVIVSVYTNEKGCWFECKDEGVGLDKEEFELLIGQYCSSNKRDDNRQIGGFGLGKMAPLSYASTVYWVCIKNGVECKYMLFKGEKGVEYSLLHEKTVESVNGVTVQFPVRSSDMWEFNRKMKQKLAYYETVSMWYEGQPVSDYKIYREKDFQLSTLNSNRGMHMCLKDVYYTIDWEKLGITSIDLPIALRFSLEDGIFPTPSREGITYTTQSKEIILNKIKSVATWFVEKYNNSVKDMTDVRQFLDRSRDNYRKVEIGTYEINVDKIEKYSSIVANEPNFKDLSSLTRLEIQRAYGYLLSNYTPILRIDRWNNRRSNLYIYSNSIDLVLCDSMPNKKVQEFLRYSGRYCTLIRPNNTTIPLLIKPNRTSWQGILGLVFRDSPKSIINAKMSDIRVLNKELVKDLVHIDDIINTKEYEDWLQSKKGEVVKSKFSIDKNQINPKIARFSEVNSWASIKDIVYVADTPKSIDTIFPDSIVVYGTVEDRSRMDTIFRTRLAKCVLLVKRDIERIEKAKPSNWVNIDKIYNMEYPLLSDFLIKYKIKKIIDLQALGKTLQYIRFLDPDFNILIEKTLDFSISGGIPEELLIELEKLVDTEENNDSELHVLYKTLEERLPEFGFVKYIHWGYSPTEDSPSVLFAKEYYNNIKQLKQQEQYNEQY